MLYDSKFFHHDFKCALCNRRLFLRNTGMYLANCFMCYSPHAASAFRCCASRRLKQHREVRGRTRHVPSDHKFAAEGREPNTAPGRGDVTEARNARSATSHHYKGALCVRFFTTALLFYLRMLFFIVFLQMSCDFYGDCNGQFILYLLNVFWRES